MDVDRYIRLKGKVDTFGKPLVTLVTTPTGYAASYASFDRDTGARLQDTQDGYVMADLTAMQAQQQAELANIQTLMTDTKTLLPQAVV